MSRSSLSRGLSAGSLKFLMERTAFSSLVMSLDMTRTGKCGSLLYSLVRDATFIHAALGTLVDSPSIRPTAHIFVGSTGAERCWL